MNLETLHIFLILLRPVVALGSLFATIYIWYPEQTKAQYHIRHTFAPLYRKIEAEYGPESYPAIMSNPSCEFFNLSKLNHWDYVFFKKDSSFVIMNIKDGSIKGEIPFDTIICANSYISIRSKHSYSYSITAYFVADSKTQFLRFDHIKYNRRLNSKYEELFNGKKLHEFIDANFIRYQDSELS